MISFFLSSIFCDCNLLFNGDESFLPSLSSSIPPIFSFPPSYLTFFSSCHYFLFSSLLYLRPFISFSLLLPSSLLPPSLLSSPFMPSFYTRSFLLPPFSLQLVVMSSDDCSHSNDPQSSRFVGSPHPNGQPRCVRYHEELL